MAKDTKGRFPDTKLVGGGRCIVNFMSKRCMLLLVDIIFGMGGKDNKGSKGIAMPRRMWLILWLREAIPKI